MRNANAQAFSEGENIVTLGYGFGTYAEAMAATYDDYSNYNFRVTGPFFGRYEHAISDHMGVGINVAYVEWVYSYEYENYNSGYTTEIGKDYYSTYSILGRFNLHFGHSEKFDPFWGVATGYRNGKLKRDKNGYNGHGQDDFSIKFPLGLETTMGVRYYISNNFGFYVEAGMAKAVFQTGIALKF